MKQRYLEVTYRNGKPMAAYLHLPRRDGDTAARTDEAGTGLLIDFTSDGRPIGIEILAPGRIDLVALNHVLADLGVATISPHDLSPLDAAA